MKKGELHRSRREQGILWNIVVFPTRFYITHMYIVHEPTLEFIAIFHRFCQRRTVRPSIFHYHQFNDLHTPHNRQIFAQPLPHARIVLTPKHAHRRRSSLSTYNRTETNGFRSKFSASCRTLRPPTDSERCPSMRTTPHTLFGFFVCANDRRMYFSTLCVV